MFNKAIYACMMFLVFALLSCGGGSTVTAVSLRADNTDVAQGASTQLTVTADKSITDNPLGEKVRFSFRANESGGRLDVVDERLDGNGQAKAIYYAGTTPGNDVIQATFDSGATAAVTIKVGTGRPVGGITVSQVGTNTLRVTVMDSRGLPVVGASVNLTISTGTLNPASGTTDENGVFQTTFELPDGVNSAQVWATSEGMRDSTTVTRPDADTGRIHLSQRANTVQATVTDRTGRPVANVPVNFSIRAGTIDSAVTTNENGVALASFTLNDGVNSTTVVATSGGVTAQITVQRVQPQIHRIVLSQRANTVQATVTDRDGRPVAEVDVNFSIRAGTIESAVKTNVNGIALASFTLPDGFNTTTVVATSGGVTAQITVQRVQPQLVEIRLQQFSEFVRATALDASGTPIPGVLINFGISAGTVERAVTTNNNGIAEARFSLPEGVNTAQVRATSGNVSRTLIVVRPEGPQPTAAGPKSLEAEQTAATGAASIRIEQAGQKVRVQLKDADGQGIPWTLLQFTMNPGTVDPVSMYTNADGSAETTFALPESALQGEVAAEGGGASASLIVR